MPYRNRPINQVKHEVPLSDLNVDASATRTSTICEGVASADQNAAAEVTIGSTVRWIFCEINLNPNVVTNAKWVRWLIGKEPFDTNLTAAGTLNGPDRRFIIKRGVEMFGKDLSQSTKRVFVVRIPPRMRRIGDNDKIVFSYQSSSTEALNVCANFIFKETK